MSQAIPKRRLDYQAPYYLIHDVKLHIDLDPTETLITSTLLCSITEAGANSASDLVLDGEGLTLQDLKVNDKACSNYTITNGNLVISVDEFTDLDTFTLVIRNTIDPSNNASLEGLYLSNGAYCTQCEAEGFRKITFFLDRPDILSVYTVTIIGQQAGFPHILSNGNLIDEKLLDNGKKQVTWHDPFKKPCYLFALVAGDFDKLSDTYTTMSGRKVSLELFVDRGKSSQGQHALESLKKAMKWDEDVFGLEYDLDIYMVVAVDFFNMGAMENKGLNVFNSKYVLAEANTATDDDFFNIEAIIGHEYFHNWTGNRVTCRDWFQLSLKEGLTVFRDQKFSADMFSYLATRISQVKVMREHQFAEDASPMSHPIRPDEVIEMNNFYTVTVYDKGAEVIRMLHTLLTEEGFRRGMDLYFVRHDGQAVTCDDFVDAMQDANNVNLDHFKLWYSQSGTPVVSVEPVNTNNILGLSFQQATKPTPDQIEKQALYVPIKLECIDRLGNKINFGLKNDTFILDTESSQLDVSEKDFVPVLLSDFSAPVILDYIYTLDDLALIMEYSSNDYSKWDASQTFYQMLINEIYQNESVVLPNEYWIKLESSLAAASSNFELLNEMLTVPSIETLVQTIDKVKPLRLSRARTNLITQIEKNLSEFLTNLLSQIGSRTYSYTKSQVNERRLKNAVIQVLSYSKRVEVLALLKKQFEFADNMTDKLNMLKAAQIGSIDLFDELMLAFEHEYADNAVVMDKWFALHASSHSDDILAKLTLLSSHKQFNIKNPNKVRSLVGSFAFYNTEGFHAADGSGYQFLTDYLIELDKINPQVASRLVTPLVQYRKFALEHQQLMRTQLERLLGVTALSKDLYEKVSKSLI
ncbi:MAG: aminopeptidase N [Glaciecola sp.]